MSVQNFIHQLEQEFTIHKNEKIALEQKAYLRDQFEFFGVKTVPRRLLQKPFLHKEYLPSKQELPVYIKSLWRKPQREFQYFAQELALQYRKQTDPSDIRLYEYMITHKSWWETVDLIATKLVANYFKHFPDEIPRIVLSWVASDNIWLQRSAILFQLKYKETTDTELLKQIIQPLSGSGEFFINKAIGWMLREYSRTNENWVCEFVSNTELSNLSRKEALRLIK